MPNVTTTTGANLLVERFKAEIQLDATEEMRIGSNFWDADGEKIGKTLYIRKIAAIPGSTLSAGNYLLSALTATANTEARTSVSAQSAHAAVILERNVLNQAIQDAAVRAGYRKQIANGLAAFIDVQCAALASGFSATVGGAGNHITRPLLTSAIKTLHTNGKSAVKPETPKFFVYHTSEIDNVLNIPDITAADVRGDGVSATVTGYVWKALGLTLGDSGNVLQASGLSHNLLHIREAAVLVYNERATILPPQENGAATAIIGYAEFGVAENYDAYGVDVVTDA